MCEMMQPQADDISAAEKILLQSYMNVTKTIAGCQAVRNRILIIANRYFL